MILYLNACVRDNSRTDRLAKALMSKLGEYKEVKLDQIGLKSLDRERLEYRTRLIEAGAYDDSIFDLAREFAAADTIVISAPYWDGSFPSFLKLYIENIYVTNIVSRYGQDGRPEGMCKADKLYYVTTAGGPYDPRFSYDHLKDLSINMFGIKETELVCIENMDIFGNDAESMLKDTIEKMKI